MTPKRRVLVIDDEKNFADLLRSEISRMGYDVDCVYTPAEALQRVADGEFDVALCDIRMPGKSGLDTLRELKAQQPSLEVIMLTGHASLETAIQAMKDGAYDYLTKPCKLEELAVLLGKAIEKAEALRDSRRLRRYLAGGPPGQEIVQASEAMKRILARLDRIAAAVDVPVLITGESGTGKEIVAREIHRRSPLQDEAFVALNCAVLQPSVLESELFGHEKGSFTGANQRKIGLFEIARGGHLFLDEVGEVSEEIQAKLLRAIQFGEFRRVGGTETLQVDVRILAATNRDLQKDIVAGRFREDLFYRLNVVPIHIPPLRDRPEDIAPLAEYFLAKYGPKDSEPCRLSREATELLLNHAWPGNVRELENFVRRLLIFQETSEISADDVEECLGSGPDSGERVPRTLRVEDVEREHILKVIRLSSGNKTKAAKSLGIALKTLYNKLNSYRDQGFDV